MLMCECSCTSFVHACIIHVDRLPKKVLANENFEFSQLYDHSDGVAAPVQQAWSLLVHPVFSKAYPFLCLFVRCPSCDVCRQFYPISF